MDGTYRSLHSLTRGLQEAGGSRRCGFDYTTLLQLGSVGCQELMAPAQSVRPDIYDVPGTPDAAPRYLSSADHATAPPTSSARRSDALTRSSLGGFRPSSAQPGLDTRKRNGETNERSRLAYPQLTAAWTLAGLPDISSGSKRNRQPAKAYSALPSLSYRSGSTSPSEAIVCPDNTQWQANGPLTARPFARQNELAGSHKSRTSVALPWPLAGGCLLEHSWK